MKHIFITILIFILSLNFSCISWEKKNQSDCATEYLKYYNYNNKTVLNEINYMSNLKEIDNQSLNFYLENGVNSEEIKQDQIITLPRSEFFNNSDLIGNISIYVMGYIGDNNIKQYVVLEINVGEQSPLYIINQVNNKIKSAFLAYSNYSTGFSSESIETKRLSNFDFQVKVYYTSDTSSKANNCNYLLTLSNEGYFTNTINHE